MEEHVTDSPRRGRLEQMLGTVIDAKYRVDAFLGRGGMGTVWKAHHLQIGRPVAIKLLRSGDDGEISEEALERFRREAAVASKLRHDNTVILYDSGVHGSSPYLVMEYLVGETLRSRLRAQGKLSIESAASICSEIAAGLMEAHSHGVLHRDLKPENVMLVSKNGVERAVVLDFGVAKLLTDSDPTLTEQGVLIGTPHYMSPEQIRGQPVSYTADVYALGIMVYEMLTGAVPFKGDSALSVAMQHLNEVPEPIERLIPESPFAAAIDGMLKQALAKNPQERFQTPLELSAALAGIISGRSEPVAAVSRQGSRVGVLFGIFLLLVVSNLYRLEHRTAPPPVVPIEQPVNDIRLEQLKEARRLVREGRNIDALQRYHRLLEMDGNNAKLLGEMGAVLLTLNQLPEAAEAFTKALAIEPAQSGIRANYGYVLLLQQRFSEAEAELRKVLAVAPHDSDSRNNLGNALLGAGKLEDAIQQFRTGLLADPKNSRAAFNLGEALVRKNDIRGAAEAYRAGLAADPSNADAIAREREIRQALEQG